MDVRLEERRLETVDPVPAQTQPPPRKFFSLSPINRRRWQNFKANKRGYWSLWIFLFLFVLSLLSEFIANDRPLLVSYKGEIYTPVLVDYPESVFGGFYAVTNFRDEFIQQEIEANGWMIWPLIRYANGTADAYPPTPFPSPPWWTMTLEERCAGLPQGVDDPNCTIGNWHWLGTDKSGGDVAARIFYGFRLSVFFGAILAIVSSIVGVAAGAVQGYFGGWLDLIFQRLIDIWTSVPQLYILLIIASVFTPSFFLLLGILLLFSWTALVGLVRAEFFRARNFEYINAARALGVSNRVIILRHMLPNAMVATLTFLPFVLIGAISTLTALDFLGVGLPPGSASLGRLLNEAQSTTTSAPWLGITGFFVMAIMLSLLMFIGEAVRDGFDPRKMFN
jgi:microcin C transport system permease protein